MDYSSHYWEYELYRICSTKILRPGLYENMLSYGEAYYFGSSELIMCSNQITEEVGGSVRLRTPDRTVHAQFTIDIGF